MVRVIDFAGFRPKACRLYRANTKGKVEKRYLRSPRAPKAQFASHGRDTLAYEVRRKRALTEQAPNVL
jgi:hypothetical protein